LHVQTGCFDAVAGGVAIEDGDVEVEAEIFIFVVFELIGK
jgi:hypothetical protein